MGRGDVVGVAADHQQLRVGDLFLPRPRLLDRREPALVGGDHQRGAGDLRHVGPDVRVVDGGVEADERGQWRSAHELDPPLHPFGGERVAEASGHRAPGPVLDALGLELLGQRGDALATRAKRRRRADHGERDHALGTARRERARDDPADLGADHVEALNSERIHEAGVIVDDHVERPLEIARHRGRGAVTAHVRPHGPEAPGQPRHPRVPGQPALGVAVQEQDRFRLRPGIREVVDLIVKVHAGRRLEGRHSQILQSRVAQSRD